MQSSGGFYILYNGLGLHNPAGLLFVLSCARFMYPAGLVLIASYTSLMHPAAYWFLYPSLVVLLYYRIKSSVFCLVSFLLSILCLVCFLFYFLQR